MQIRTASLAGVAADPPRFTQPVALAILAVVWGALLLYDLILDHYASRSPADYDILRVLLPLGALVPVFLRLLHPSDIRDDADAYVTFVRLSTLLTILALTSIIIGMLPVSYSDEGVAASLWSFLVGRSAALVPLLMLPPIIEAMLRLLRYRSRLTVPRLATGAVWLLMIVAVVAQFVPGGDPVTEDHGPAVFFSVLCSLSVLYLALRARWLVNLRKGRKLSILGLSFLGMLSSTMLIAMGTEHDVSASLYAFFPALPALGFAVGVSLALMHSALFVKALMVLPTAEAIDRRNAEVDSLATFGRLLTRSFDMSDLVDTSLAVACDVTAAQAAWIELRNGEPGGEILCGSAPAIPLSAARRRMLWNVGGMPMSEAVGHHRTLQVAECPPSIAAAGAHGGGEPISLVQPRTIAAAPLSSGDILLGTLYVAKDKSGEFDREDLEILKAIADQIALSIEHARLIHSSIERERIEQEMMIARDLQERLLPRTMPESDWFEIHAESQPAELVGGDYYDLVSFQDGTLGVVIGDVSGKGASAALYMGMIKGVIQALSGSTADPKELLSRINVALHGQSDQRWFATMTCAQILEQQRILRIARAGHCPTLIVRGGHGEYHRPAGLGLALARPLLFERFLDLEEVHFSADDYVVFLSDGLPEARSPEGEEFGYDRLMSIVTAAVGGNPTPSELRNRIFTELAAFTRGEPPIDDTTVVVLRWKSSEGHHVSRDS